MAPAKYTRDFFNANAPFREEWDEAVKDSVEIPVHLLPRMKMLQMVPWRTNAVTSGDTLIEWIQKHEKMEGFIPGMTGLSVCGTLLLPFLPVTRYLYSNPACRGIFRF